MTSAAARDYGLAGAETPKAAARGLAEADWFQPVVDPAAMRELQARSDLRGAADQLLWLVLLVGTGVLVVWTWRSWWTLPALFLYGALYCGAADSRWHECGHGTAFRTAWLNDACYYFASFLMLRGPTVWRWSHYRHHTDTIIVGRDAEIAFPRPANVGRTALGYTGWWVLREMLWRLVRHSVGRIDADARSFVPESELRKVVWESRVFVAIVVGVGAWAVVAGTPLPLLLVGLPTVYGTWLMVFFGITQHAGLREDVLDHRLNSRTVYMNPIFRFLYLNMNYHVEHHIFPSVPYRNLPRLHDTIRDQLAPAKPSVWAAYREIWSTLRRQQRDPDYELPIELPDVAGTARPVEVGERHWVRHRDGAVDLGSDAALVEGEIRRVDVDGRTFVLCRAGEIVLADGECTHQQVHLCGGAIVDGAIECPKHNGRFDLRTGEPVRTPARNPIGLYDVTVIDGRIVSRLTPRA